MHAGLHACNGHITLACQAVRQLLLRCVPFCRLMARTQHLYRLDVHTWLTCLILISWQLQYLLLVPAGATYCVKVSARAQDPPALTPPAAAAQLTQTAPNSTTQRNSTGASAPAALFDGGQAAAPGPAADGATGAAGNAASASGSDALLLLNTLLSNSKNESGTGELPGCHC